MLRKVNGDPCKVAFNATALLSPLAGIGQYVKYLLMALDDMDDLQVSKFYAGYWSRDIRQQGISEAAQNSKLFIRKYVPYFAQMYRWLQQQRFAAGTHSGQADLYHEPNFLAYRFEGPTVLTVHDLSWIRYPHMHPAERVASMNRYFEPSLHRATRIITDSEFVKRELMEVFGINPNIIHPVLLGVEADFRPHTPAETAESLRTHGLQHGKYTLALGTLEPRKNLQLALSAFERLPAELQERFPLVLVGMRGWSNDALEQRMAPLLRSGRIRQLGYLSRADLVKVVAGARCMVYPSVYEGFGLPPLESMACGVPVITSNVSSLPEVVGETGIQISPEDEKGLAMAMQSLLEDATLHANLSQAALMRSSALTWQECARQTRQVYALAMSDVGV